MDPPCAGSRCEGLPVGVAGGMVPICAVAGGLTPDRSLSSETMWTIREELGANFDHTTSLVALRRSLLQGVRAASSRGEG